MQSDSESFSFLHGMCSFKEAYESVMDVIRKNADQVGIKLKVEGRRGRSSAAQYVYWIVVYSNSRFVINDFWKKIFEYNGGRIRFNDTFGPNAIPFQGYPEGFFDSDLLETITIS